MSLYVLKDVATSYITKSFVGGGNTVTLDEYDSVTVMLTALVLYIVLLFLGQWIWNNILTQYVDVPPLESVLHLLGLVILGKLIFASIIQKKTFFFIVY